MAGETAQGSKSESLEQADEDLSKDSKANQNADNSEQACPESAAPAKHWYHVGLRFDVRQYNIKDAKNPKERKLALELPVSANDPVSEAKKLNDLSGSEFPATKSNDNPRSPKKSYPVGADPDMPDAIQADLTSQSKLKWENTVEGYQLDGKEASLNECLGKAIAIHLKRTGTYTTVDTGNFKASTLGKRSTALQNTEKMGIKLFAYLKSKIGGKDGIYEIKDGAIGATVSQADYDKRKRIEDGNKFSDKECGAMPLIPGVYQVHVLIADAGVGAFSIEEVYCDGDCIYPN